MWKCLCLQLLNFFEDYLSKVMSAFAVFVIFNFAFSNAFQYRSCIFHFIFCGFIIQFTQRKQRVIKREPLPSTIAFAMIFQCFQTRFQSFFIVFETAYCKIAPERRTAGSASVHTQRVSFSFRILDSVQYSVTC